MSAIRIEHFAAWLANGERGLSSEAIVARLTDHPVGRYSHALDYPHDAGDFRRCEVLLRHYPLARFMIGEMRAVSPAWAALVDAWDELVTLAESEAPDCFADQPRSQSAPLTSRRIAAIVTEARR